jgi:hypothetical protein
VALAGQIADMFLEIQVLLGKEILAVLVEILVVIVLQAEVAAQVQLAIMAFLGPMVRALVEMVWHTQFLVHRHIMQVAVAAARIRI